MGLGGVWRAFRLYLWYLDFSMLSTVSYAFFYAYLLSYDRFAVAVSGLGPGSWGIWVFLYGEASSVYEEFLFYLCAATAASILFGRERVEGYSYARYLAGVGRIADFGLKWLAYIALVVAPLLAAKALLAAVWGGALLLEDPLGFTAAGAVYAAGMAAAASYVFPFLALLSTVLGRPSHVVLSVAGYLYLFDNVFVRGALTNPLSLTGIYMSLVPLRPGVFPPPCSWAAFLVGVAAAVLVYAGWGEVEWR